MIGLQLHEPGDVIAIIRLVPIIAVFIIGVYNRLYKLAFIGFTFACSVIANQFYQNREVAGIFSALSAYTLLFLATSYVMKHGKSRL